MADDDLPLANLAAAKKVGRKIEDDTPLSVLAPKVAIAQKSGRPPKNVVAPKAATPQKKPLAPPAGKGPAKGAGKGKVKGKRRSPSGSSGDSSYSYSSEDEEPLVRTNSKRAAPKRKKTATDDNGLETDAQPIKKRDRSQKDDIVAQLLSRWWYADEYVKEDWPPTDPKYYEAELEKRQLRKVLIQEWEWLPEQDERGRRKVYELAQYPGCFRDSTGELIDLRPADRRPCYNNFAKKNLHVLCTMLISAYENQLKDLARCRYVKQSQMASDDIKVALSKTQAVLHNAAATR